jgi:hypothetical protein
METKELTKKFLNTLEFKIKEFLDLKSQYNGLNDELLFQKELCENIEKFELVSGELAKYENSKRYLIEYDIHPKKLRGIVYRNLVYKIEEELTSFVNSKVILFEY